MWIVTKRNITPCFNIRDIYCRTIAKTRQECLIVDVCEATWHHNTLQVQAICENLLNKARHTVGNCDASQTMAIIEGTHTDTRESAIFTKPNIYQVITVYERIITNACDAIGDCDAPQVPVS